MTRNVPRADFIPDGCSADSLLLFSFDDRLVYHLDLHVPFALFLIQLPNSSLAAQLRTTHIGLNFYLQEGPTS